MRRKQQEVINRILNLLTELVDELPAERQVETKPVEMLTIKECTETVKGISEHTIRKLVAQEHVRYIRTGEGKRGKILVSKQSLLDYLGGTE